MVRVTRHSASRRPPLAGQPFLAAFALVCVALVGHDAAATAPRGDVRAVLDSLWSAGRRAEFHDLLDREIARAAGRRDTAATIALLTLGGARNISVGRVLEAEDLLRQGLALAAAARDSASDMPAWRWYALALSLQGRFGEASQACEKLLATARTRNDAYHAGWAQVGLAYAALQLGRVDQAQAAYQAGEEALRMAGDAAGELWARNGLAMTKSRRGDLRGALSVYLALVDRAVELGDPMAEAMAVNNVGHCQYLLGDPGAAQASFARSRRRHEEHGQIRQALTPMLNLALCLRDLGQFDAAADTLRNCRQRSLARGYLDIAGQAVLEQAALERRLGRPRAAAATARDALALGERLAVQDRARATVVLAEALADLDSCAAALVCLDRVSEEVPAAALGGVARELGLARARALANTGEHAAAYAVLDTVVAAASAADDDQSQILALLQLGRLLVDQGRPGEAREPLRAGIAIWERQRALPVEPEWRESRASAGQALATELAALLLDAGGGSALEEAYEVLQTYKARTLLERRLGPGVSLPPGRFAVSLDSLRASVLNADECLLDLYLGERHGLLFAITADTVACWRLPAADDLIARERSLRALLVDIAAPANTADRIRVLGAAVSGFRRALLGPATAVTAGRGHVILAADGVAHRLPLEPWPETGQRSATVWSRTPSAVVLARLRAGPPSPPIAAATPLLIIADDGLPDGRRLAGVRREEQQLRRQFRGFVNGWSAAPDRDTGAQYARAAVIHVAAHAEIDDQAPWQSRLGIAAGPTREPWRADQIAGTPTGAGLIVLSSCATAQGRAESGEGLVGLASAFLAGGARAIVATLWPIDDAAGAAFMDRFYRELAAGVSIAEALSQAREDLQRIPRYADPFFWAPYIVIGDGSLAIEIAGRG